jgi:hypothetical protein
LLKNVSNPVAVAILPDITSDDPAPIVCLYAVVKYAGAVVSNTTPAAGLDPVLPPPPPTNSIALKFLILV